ncbi:uncharacterized protein LOC124178330 [Neodiprion fabricii]|uniref:uncharacterized protein LOC124178330 n=1 Tax=Neodiprion fabricii TaxID=2872261 RepID=UPI001ED97550|nr:uncharacterized protein LOC124178330 [Neodiprion fabricii]
MGLWTRGNFRRDPRNVWESRTTLEEFCLAKAIWEFRKHAACQSNAFPVGTNFLACFFTRITSPSLSVWSIRMSKRRIAWRINEGIQGSAVKENKEMESGKFIWKNCSNPKVLNTRKCHQQSLTSCTEALELKIKVLFSL